MKMTCEREKLLHVFQTAASVAPTRSPKPILQNLKLEVSKDAGILMGTDMEVGIRIEVPGICVDTPGNVLLPISRFLSILRENSDEKLVVEGDGRKILVRGQYSEFQLPSENPDADIDPKRAESMAQNYGLHAYDSMEKLLENEQVDVVHLCTPHYLHVPMAQVAASRNIHVFTEKPPAIDRNQWAKPLDVAQKVRVGVCFQNRYNGSVIKLLEMLKGGGLGKVLGARAFVTWARNKEYYTESGWRGKQSTEGGGALINQSIHTLDLMVHLLGKPHHVAATLSNHHLKGIINVEDTVEAYMTFADAPGLFYATTAYCTNSPVFLEIICEDAAVRMEKDTLTIIWSSGEEERFEFKNNLPVTRDYWGSAHVTCISEYYDALENGRDVPIGLKQVQDTVDTMFAIYGK